MSPKLELILTLLVCTAGFVYFSWKGFVSEGNQQLFYIALVIVSLIYGQRSIKDVLAKMRGDDDDKQGR